MQRTISKAVKSDLDKKIVLLAGPRQVGKTTLSKALFEENDYLNFDIPADRKQIMARSWDRKKPLVILDEIHKLRNWKQLLKGVYDGEGVRPRLMVTGSARLDLIRKTGDSLAGRHFLHHLFPFDLKELHVNGIASSGALETLLRCGGFPEPFLSGKEEYARRWRTSHLEIILRQDLVTLASLRDVVAIETLIELLRGRVGSGISYASLARDLERDPKTIKSWIELLENMFIVFTVKPFHQNLARAILKEPKCYFFDLGQVDTPDDHASGPKLENLVALALKKELARLKDEHGHKGELFFARTKEGKEIDFVVVIERKARLLVEVKKSDGAMSPCFDYFSRVWPTAKKVQLVYDLARETTYPNGVEVRRMADFLAELDLLKLLPV